MKAWTMLLAMLPLAGLAQLGARPQFDATRAATHTVADYLAQGPTPWTPPVSLHSVRGVTPDWVVDANGHGTHTSLQAALDTVPAAATGPSRRWVIGLTAGTYRGQVCLQGKAPLALVGLGATVADVRIVGDRFAGLPKRAGVDGGNPCLPDLAARAYGTFSSATLAVFSDDVQLTHLTVENDAMNQVRRGIGYPPEAAESGGAQAVALMTQGDRIHLHDVALLGHQDTLYVRASRGGDRVYLHQSLIAGDVDFIFGDGTLVIDDSTVLSRAGRRSPGHGGHILAPSTDPSRSLGLLVNRSRLISEAGLAPGAISLGRAWDQGVAKGQWQLGHPNGQALVRDSVLGPHIGPWAASTARRPFGSEGPAANRMGEWNNQHLPARDHSRETLPGLDGWAAAHGGTQGGAAARPERVFTVTTRAELARALAAPGIEARIVRVQGRIDLSADDAGRTLGFADFRAPPFEWHAYAAAYNPRHWGRTAPTGPLEAARQRSAHNQAAHVVLKVPPHTTLIGLGTDAALVNGGLLVEGVDNVILRNLHFSDAYDHFPAWDPKDNGHGEWNANYDGISLRGATHVWIDHCSFDDGERPDAREPVLLGQRMQHHDGLLDITRQSNWVTVSWSHFRAHDKTTLVGGSDTHLDDDGRLKVTFHHNWYQGVRERTPRVRFGQVHLYNNLFEVETGQAHAYEYSLGLGFQSRVVSEANAWVTPPDVATHQLVRSLKGRRLFDQGSMHNGLAIDLLGALRGNHAAIAWQSDAGWTPTLWLDKHPAEAVPAQVRQGAGAGRDAP